MQATFTEIQLRGERFLLHPQRAMFHPVRRTLLLADLHIGKVGHFRKNGIPLPQRAAGNNFARLRQVIHEFRPAEVIFLGDLFHSSVNEEFGRFARFLDSFSDIGFSLVRGNHDVQSEGWLGDLPLKVLAPPLHWSPFLLTHHPEENPHESLYNLAGHVHPGVRLSGQGRQSLRLPCFWFGPDQGLLPAFGEFTGKYTVQPREGDRIFAIAGEEILAFS